MLTNGVKKVISFLKTDVGIALLVSILWQTGFTLIGWLLTPEQGVLGHMNHWDAGWYHHIIDYQYSQSGNPATAVFYPLFPSLVSIVSFVSFGIFNLEISALIINTVSLWLIILSLIKIASYYGVSKAARCISILAFLSFPTTFFLHVFYSEATFIAIGLWSYLFALNRKWWAVGLLLALLSATRLPSVLFIALCGLEYLQAYKWRIKDTFNKNILWFFLAPTGFVSYGLYLSVVRGDFLAMFHAYSATNDWTYHVFTPNIIHTIINSSSEVIGSIVSLTLNHEIFVNKVIPLICLTILFSCSIYILLRHRRKALPLAIFGLLSFILFTLNGNLVSVHRYSLACITIFIAIMLLAHKKIARYIIISLCVTGIILQIFLYIKFINGVFAG